MTDKTSRQIEREIEQERAALSRSIDQLQDQFSPEHMVETAKHYVTRHGSDVASSIGRAAKENPLALALTGVGLAWLVAGGSKPRRGRYASVRPVDYRDYDDIDYDDAAPRYASTGFRAASADWDRSESDTVQGFRNPRPVYGGMDARIEAADAAMRARHYDYDRDDDEEETLWGRISDAALDAYEDAKEGLGEAAESVSEAADAVRTKVAGTAADARSHARSGAARARSKGYDAKWKAQRAKGYFYQRSAELRDRLADGTEAMSESARRRVITARIRALEAQEAAERMTRENAAKARDLAQREPLATAAVVAGIGALAAALLPSTRTEDEYVGPYRDSAFDEAERIFREESVKLKKVAEAALDEGKAMVSEATSSLKSEAPHGEDAVNKAEDSARSGMSRIADAAKAEAKQQNLGGSVSK